MSTDQQIEQINEALASTENKSWLENKRQEQNETLLDILAMQQMKLNKKEKDLVLGLDLGQGQRALKWLEYALMALGGQDVDEGKLKELRKRCEGRVPPSTHKGARDKPGLDAKTHHSILCGVLPRQIRRKFWTLSRRIWDRQAPFATTRESLERLQQRFSVVSWAW